MDLQRLSAILYGAAFAGFSFIAYLLYPIFGNESYSGLTNPPPTIVVFQQGSFGDTPVSVQVRIGSVQQDAELTIEQINLADSSQRGSKIVLFLETWTGEGFSYVTAPLKCQATADDSPLQTREVSTTVLAEVYARGVEDGDVGGVPEFQGSATEVVLSEAAVTFEMSCELPDFQFVMESIANRNVYLPGIEAHGIGRAIRPVRSYNVAREGSDFIVQSSQPPSETLAGSYTWYERDFNSFARQGLFFTSSNPGLQQQNSYRLFVAGAMLGLAGGFLVAAIQELLQHRSTQLKP